MASFLDIPAVVRRVDSNLVTITSTAWTRRLEEQWWRRVVKPRSSETGTDIIQWLLETAKLRNKDLGGQSTYSDWMAHNFSISATEVGDDFKAKAIELLNALGGQNGPQKNALDLAGAWGRQMGAQGADWPQLQAARFMTGDAMAGGGSPVFKTAYDGLPFFSPIHWTNPVTKKSGETFANVFYGWPFTAQNYARLGGYIESIPGPDGRPRKIKPKVVATGSFDRFNASSIFSATAEVVSDPNVGATGNAGVSNVVRTLYTVDAPISDADLNMTGEYAGAWWISCELREDDTLGPMLFTERLPFTLRGYTDFTDVLLARSEEFEWKYNGWNQFSGGHPFLLFLCVPQVPSGKSAFVLP